MSEAYDDRWERLTHVERFGHISNAFDTASRMLKDVGAPPVTWFDMCALAVVYMLKISPRGTPEEAYKTIDGLRLVYQNAMVVGEEAAKARKSRS